MKDWSRYIPRETQANLRWRKRMRWMGLGDLRARAAFRQAAYEDPIFFFNAMVWSYDPRLRIKEQPFIVYPHQEPVFLGIDRAIEDAEASDEPVDVTVLKSRAQGGTVGPLSILVRRWLRDRMFTAQLVTRNEKLVDSDVDSDTLLWKVAYTIRKLPFWMRPRGFNFRDHRRLSDHTIFNPEKGGTIVGSASTAESGRGGRRTVAMVDEFGSEEFQTSGKDEALLASLHHNTNCLLVVSTYGSEQGAFYRMAHEPETFNSRHYVLDWRDNPEHSRLKYRMTGGKAQAIKAEDQEELQVYMSRNVRTMRYLQDRGFVREGRDRSPWYDRRCLRSGATPQAIARELDMDPHGARSKVFNLDMIERIGKTKAMPALIRGRFVYDAETATAHSPWVAIAETGELRLWVDPGLSGAIPVGEYVAGVDISGGEAGEYTANSVVSMVNRLTGEQVAEWASKALAPERFAALTVALCRWFHGAYLVYEANFSGGFATALLDTHAYGNIYIRETDIEGLHQKTKKPGFWMTDDKRSAVFEALDLAMRDGSFTPRSEELLVETKDYEWREGKIVNVMGQRKGRAHADRVIAASLAWFGCRDVELMGMADGGEEEPPEGSLEEMLRRSRYLEPSREDPWLNPAIDVFTRRSLESVGDLWK